MPQANIVSIPMADGGEGTTDSLIDATHGKKNSRYCYWTTRRKG